MMRHTNGLGYWEFPIVPRVDWSSWPVAGAMPFLIVLAMFGLSRRDAMTTACSASAASWWSSRDGSRDAGDAWCPGTWLDVRGARWLRPWAEGVAWRATPAARGWLIRERERDEQQGAEAAGRGRDEGLGHGELNNLRVDGR